MARGVLQVLYKRNKKRHPIFLLYNELIHDAKQIILKNYGIYDWSYDRGDRFFIIIGGGSYATRVCDNICDNIAEEYDDSVIYYGTPVSFSSNMFKHKIFVYEGLKMKDTQFVHDHILHSHLRVRNPSLIHIQPFPHKIDKYLKERVDQVFVFNSLDISYLRIVWKFWGTAISTFPTFVKLFQDVTKVYDCMVIEKECVSGYNIKW